MMMQTYRVLTPVRNGGPEPIGVGQPIELSDRDAAPLVALMAIELAPELAEPTAPASLERMTKPQLLEIAAAEGVAVDEDDTKAAIVTAIERKRAGGSDEPEPLAQQSKAELLVTAAAEGVEVKDSDTKAAIIAAIEAKRAGAAERPLTDLSRDELVDLAAAEDVEFADDADEAALIAAIEAKRDA